MEYIEITSENAEDFANYIDEDMQDNLDRTFFRGIGAIDENGEARGAMVYEIKNSESEQDTRSRVRLFNGDEKAKEFLITRYTDEVSEEEVAESFYESSDETMSRSLGERGFSFSETESLDVCVSFEDVKKISNFLKIKKMPPFIKNLSDVSILQYRTFVKNCLFKGNRGLLDDLAYLPKNWFDVDVSSCALDGDEVKGALLIKRSPSGVLYVGLYYAFGPDSQKNLALLMANTANRILEVYPEDTRVIIRRHNEMVRKLTAKLFAGSKGDSVYSGTRTENESHK